jgi:glyoxylase-like metal-dependent hydrolase (beta-lactamase superfamily II)
MFGMTTMTLETPVEGLEATAPQSLSFAPSTQVRAFLLRRPLGDLLVYANAHASGMSVSRQYLGHWHEAAVAGRDSGAPLFVHEADHEQAAEHLHVRASFTRHHVLDDDFEVIPMPGHTPGSTAYLWDNEQHRFLFTADSLYLGRNGQWRAAVLESSDRDEYIRSLERLRELEFDVLVPWAAPVDGPYVDPVGPAEGRRRLDAVIERLRRGEDS